HRRERRPPEGYWRARKGELRDEGGRRVQKREGYAAIRSRALGYARARARPERMRTTTRSCSMASEIRALMSRFRRPLRRVTKRSACCTIAEATSTPLARSI